MSNLSSVSGLKSARELVIVRCKYVVVVAATDVEALISVLGAVLVGARYTVRIHSTSRACLLPGPTSWTSPSWAALVTSKRVTRIRTTRIGQVFRGRSLYHRPTSQSIAKPLPAITPTTGDTTKPPPSIAAPMARLRGCTNLMVEAPKYIV